MPVGVDTYGAYVTKGIKLVKQIGQKNQEATGEKLSTFFLFQSMSMAVQRGNAVCVRGHSTTTWTEFCHFLTPPLRGQFLYPELGQKQTFFDPLPPSSCPRSY